ncbi:2-C-methyl-D-erythritol 4-phosphate cytidylyltransferase [Rhodococcus sp. ACS1]|uniref:2-C-methyl-D-erythritol 4-phosphate cytidylyltransferase n=1 Tax=Rhodococcus koreensis TaxID=99653 RepID=A0A1H4TSP8_9NOCA|nr:MULTISPECIES: 2-C-methyl-D-erythritol 4-phosphate cytidylyltransferase [Rhodococcus]PBC46061.1 2-C-methyl-D-erythritol 4-phosphate cytidylyltransferase [Rhodococcus sp. ACS1]QSE82019.1 2-C-methyl-D-erythritol 4-phosphate cytidylyltransferase [Rhodococcus koreensis]SEC59260.1 2-C-methyl-D-erythritol 4-phosphate cytidylyltransferase [Rhodococcus koreensis]
MAEGQGPVVALVPAAGQGVRLGENKPKAFVDLGGTTMLTRAVDGLLQSGAVDRVVVIVPEELVESTRSLLPGDVTVVAGGSERTDSVRAGLAVADDAEYVLVHDAARALTPPSLIARVVAELRCGRTAVIPVLPVADTIKTVDVLGAVTGTPERSELRAVQTPQGFTAELLRRAYAAADGIATDDAGLVERLGERVRSIVGEPTAFKITTPLDLVLARALVEEGAH